MARKGRAVPSGEADAHRKIAAAKGGDGGRYELRFFEKDHVYYALGGRYRTWTWVPSASKIAKRSEDASGRLMGWAVKQAQARTEEFLRDTLKRKGPRALTLDLVIQALEQGKKQPDRTKDEAGDRGKRVHKMMERMLSGQRVVKTDMRLEHAALDAWAKAWKVKPLLLEFLLLDAELGFAGTGDLLALATDPESSEGEQLWYFDLKTGKYTHKSNFAQGAGYRRAYRWEHGKTWDRAALLHLPLGAQEIDVKRQTWLDKDEEAFASARYLHWWTDEQESAARRAAA